MAEWLAQLALATCATTATTAVPDREPPTQLAVDIDGEQNEDVGYIRHGYADGASWDWHELRFATSLSGKWARSPSSRRRRSAWLWVAKTAVSWHGIVSYMRNFCNDNKGGYRTSVRRTSWPFHQANLFDSGSYVLSSRLLEIRIGTFFGERRMAFP